MKTEYRNQQIENARKEYVKARAVYDSQMKWNSKKQSASDDLEFWGNKLAFLEQAK